MRPEIPDGLQRRIEAAYERVGYATPSELVRDAVRQRLAIIEADEDSPRLVGLAQEQTDGGSPIVTDNKRSDPLKMKNSGSDDSEKPLEDRKWDDDEGIKYGANPFIDEPVVVDRFGANTCPNQITAGKIGTGKTVSTLLQLRRECETRTDARVVYIDPIGCGEYIPESLGVQRVDLNGMGCNPLDVGSQGTENAPHGMSTLRRQTDIVTTLVQTLSEGQTYRKNADVYRSVLMRALERAQEVESQAGSALTFEDLRDELITISDEPQRDAFPGSSETIEKVEEAANELYVQTRHFSEGEPLKQFAQSTEFSIGEKRVTWIPVTDYYGGNNVMALLSTVYTVFEQAKRASEPVIIAIDDAHPLLRDPAMVELNKMMRHARQFDISFHLVTQSVDEFSRSESGQSLIKNTSIIHLHRLPPLSEELMSILNLSSEEGEYIRQASPGHVGDNGAETLVRVKDKWIPTTVEYENEREEAMFESDGAFEEK